MGFAPPRTVPIVNITRQENVEAVSIGRNHQTLDDPRAAKATPGTMATRIFKAWDTGTRVSGYGNAYATYGLARSHK